LMIKAKNILQEKIKSFETLLGASFASLEKRINDGFKIMLPVEMYESYEAFNSSSLNLKKSANVNTLDKSTTFYYQPIIDKEFDFVINPVILEPVIQIMYEIKIYREKKPTQKNNKEYFIITPNGVMKSLNINK